MAALLATPVPPLAGATMPDTLPAVVAVVALPDKAAVTVVKLGLEVVVSS